MNDIEKAIEVQKKLIEKWESRAKKLEKTINKYPWGRDGLQYDFGDWRESELKRRKEQIKIALITISALEKQIPKGPIGNDNGSYAEYFESWLECPKCGEAIPEYTAENNTWCYCLGCGQKLDWEVANESTSV